jgi:hypothetical protein
MELFRNTDFDFLGRKWWFILPSLFLIIAGFCSILARGGPLYGIDFTGGAEMEVRWDGAPPIEQIRSTVATRLKGISVVAAHDMTGSNEVLISAPLPQGIDLTGVRHLMEETLSKVSTRYSVRSFEVIGPQIGNDLRRQAIMATGGATGGMLLYLSYRFRPAYGEEAEHHELTHPRTLPLPKPRDTVRALLAFQLHPPPSERKGKIFIGPIERFWAVCRPTESNALVAVDFRLGGDSGSTRELAAIRSGKT